MAQSSRETEEQTPTLPLHPEVAASGLPMEAVCKAEGVPKKRDREATSRALLEAAKCVFAEHGFDAATTREIACRAQANEALIQRYFGGKAGLLEAILKDGPRACTGAPPAAGRESLTLEQTLVSFFHRSCGETEERQQFMKVVVSRAILDSSIASVMREKIFDHDRAVIRAQLEALKADGRIRCDAELEPVAHALASLAFSLGFFGRLVYQTPEGETQAAIAATARLMAESLQPARAPASP